MNRLAFPKLMVCHGQVVIDTMHDKNTNSYNTLILFAICAIIAIVANYLAKKRELERDITGVIRKIEFDEKRTPNVTVDNVTFPLLTFTKYFSLNLGIGDTIIKKKNSTIYKLIKVKTRKVVYSYQSK